MYQLASNESPDQILFMIITKTKLSLRLYVEASQFFYILFLCQNFDGKKINKFKKNSASSKKNICRSEQLENELTCQKSTIF